MPNIILVANNLQSTKRVYQSSKVSKDDIIVRFNIALMSSKDRTDYVLFRKTSRGYLGFDIDFKIKNPLLLKPGVKYIFISKNQDYLDQIFQYYPIIKDNHEIISTHPLSKVYQIKPSSGFIAIDYFMKKYPDYPIKLFNFSWDGWSGHNFQFEKDLCLQWAQEGKIAIIKNKSKDRTKDKNKNKNKPNINRTSSKNKQINKNLKTKHKNDIQKISKNKSKVQDEFVGKTKEKSDIINIYKLSKNRFKLDNGKIKLNQKHNQKLNQKPKENISKESHKDKSHKEKSHKDKSHKEKSHKDKSHKKKIS